MAAYAAELAVTAQGRAVYERSCSVQLHVPAQGGVCMRRVGMGSERGEGKDAHGLGMCVAHHHFTRTSRGKRVLSLVCTTVPYYEVRGGVGLEGRARLDGRCGSVWPQPTMTV